MRVSTQDGTEIFTLKIEGKVVGEWASELQRFWTTLIPSLGTRKLCLDICGILYLDSMGKHVLQEIVGTTDAEVLADSPLTKQFADEARRKSAEERRRGESTCTV